MPIQYLIPFVPALMRLFSGLWFAEQMDTRLTEKERAREQNRVHYMGQATLLATFLIALIALSGGQLPRFEKSVFVLAVGTSASLLAYAIQAIKIGRWIALLALALGDCASFSIYLGISYTLLASELASSPVRAVAVAAPVAYGLFYITDFRYWWLNLRAKEN